MPDLNDRGGEGRDALKRYGIDGVEDAPWEERGREKSGFWDSGAINVLIYVFAVLCVSVLLAFFGWLAADDVLGLTDSDKTVQVTIDENDGISDVSHKLKKAGLIDYEWLFSLYGKYSHAEDKIDPGTYELNKKFDYRALVVGMGAVAETRVTVTVVIPEGYEEKQIFELLEQNEVSTVALLNEAAAKHDFDYYFLDGISLGESNRLEGYLFPDTYEFYVDEDPVSVINKLLANFDRKFTEDMLARIDELNGELRVKMEGIFTESEMDEHMLDMRDIVIIASLIEKEAANNSERPEISSVIHNRLTSKLYPALQIDATVQYALGERKEILTGDDLAIESPYNTYNNAGLPVGPIANPGLASIKAALFPADTDYYFYALDTDGSHHFSETYIQHSEFLASLGGE